MNIQLRIGLDWIRIVTIMRISYILLSRKRRTNIKQMLYLILEIHQTTNNMNNRDINHLKSALKLNK